MSGGPEPTPPARRDALGGLVRLVEGGARARGGPTRALVPFAIVLALGIGIMLVPPYGHDLARVLAALAATAVFVAISVVAIRLPPRHPLTAAPALYFFFVVALARHATGGTASPLAPLAVLAVLWIILQGSRLQLYLAAIATALVYALPVVLIGRPLYEPSDWRRGVVWLLVIAIVCPSVQRAVQRLRGALAEQRRLAGQLEAMFNAATEHAIIATDLEGRITQFSDGAERMLGFTAEEMMGRSPAQQIHSSAELLALAAELGVDPSADLLLLGVPSTGALRRAWTYRRKDGTTLRVRLALSRVHGPDGRHAGYVGIAHDITSREQADAELENAARRWRQLVDHLPETAVYVIGPRLEYRVAAGVLPTSAATVVGKTLYDLSGPANIARLEPMFRAALAGETSSTEVTATHGDTVHEVIVTPLPSHAGEPEALVVSRDVTAARRREAELRIARDRFERLFSEAPHGIMLLDARGTIRQVNPVICSMMRLGADQMVGTPTFELPYFHDAERPSRLPALLAGEIDRATAERHLRPGQPDELHLAITAVPLRGADGTLDAVLVTMVDVTDRKRAEDALAHLADHDPLTGLCNRRRFDVEVHAHLRRCRRDGARGALMTLDLDGFKQINDTYGHAAGDALIVATAEVLRRRMRGSDVIARLGGDEFAVLLPDVDVTGAETVARDVVALIRESAASSSGDGGGGGGAAAPPWVTTSIGVVPIRDPAIEPDGLMRAADTAMYAAKDAGRDRYVVHDAPAADRPETAGPAA